MKIKVAVGNDHVIETWALQSGFRTQAQFDVVRAIVAESDFDFSCVSQMFKKDLLAYAGFGYQGPVSFTYYTNDGVLHSAAITHDGAFHIYLQES